MITSLKDFSRTVGLEPVEVHPSLSPLVQPGTVRSVTGLVSLRIKNVSATAIIWLSRTGQAAINAPGSYPLKPGGSEDWTPPHIPLERLSAVADTDGAALTVELRYLPRVFVSEAERV